MTNIPPPQPPIWEHGQRRMSLVQSVLAEVLNGYWKPGQHLVGQELADRYGVSQTPIREALITLAGIGVVDLLPNRGAIVRNVTVQDVRNVCHVRRILECEAARCAAPRIDTDEVAAMIAAVTELKTAPPGRELLRVARETDDRFHELVSRSCGNPLLHREISRLKLLFRAYRDVVWDRAVAVDDLRRIQKEADEHLAVLHGLAARDASAAARMMGKHIRSGERYWCRLMAASIPAVSALANKDLP